LVEGRFDVSGKTLSRSSPFVLMLENARSLLPGSNAVVEDFVDDELPGLALEDSITKRCPRPAKRQKNGAD